MPAMLVVSDLWASIDFYEAVIGLELVDRTASAAALAGELVFDESELNSAAADGQSGLRVRSADKGAGPTRDELQRLDWSVLNGGVGGEVEAMQAATLRHADGTWLRLLQIGAVPRGWVQYSGTMPPAVAVSAGPSRQR